MGSLQILNVGEGDVRIEFDRSDVAEAVRAKRIIHDMLRRGYALLVEVERDGEKRFERAKAFDELTGSYVIADFDPSQAGDWKPEVKLGQASQTEEKREEVAGAPAATQPAEPAVSGARRRGRPSKKLPMEGTRAIGVGRSAGG